MRRYGDNTSSKAALDEETLELCQAAMVLLGWMRSHGWIVAQTGKQAREGQTNQDLKQGIPSRIADFSRF